MRATVDLPLVPVMAMTGTRAGVPRGHSISMIGLATSRGAPSEGSMCMRSPGAALTSITPPPVSRTDRAMSGQTKSTPQTSSPTIIARAERDLALSEIFVRSAPSRRRRLAGARAGRPLGFGMLSGAGRRGRDGHAMRRAGSGHHVLVAIAAPRVRFTSDEWRMRDAVARHRAGTRSATAIILTVDTRMRWSLR